jgi:hypothetical protein
MPFSLLLRVDRRKLAENARRLITPECLVTRDLLREGAP